jgi:hypothetical protein
LTSLYHFGHCLTQVGARVSQACGSQSRYFSAIDECVPLSIASSKVFVDAISAKKRCAGGRISTKTALEALRFCDVITSALSIEVNEMNADFTALHDIETIEGLCSDWFVF